MVSVYAPETETVVYKNKTTKGYHYGDACIGYLLIDCDICVSSINVCEHRNKTTDAYRGMHRT